MRRRLAIVLSVVPLFAAGLLAPSALGGAGWQILSTSPCKGNPKKCTTSTTTGTTSTTTPSTTSTTTPPTSTTTPSTTTTTTATSTTSTTSTTTTTTATAPAPAPKPAAPACTLYASPSGVSTNSGLTSSSPLPFLDAYRKTAAGSVVCLLPGTYPISSPFFIGHSGAPGSPVVYRGEPEGSATFVYTGASALSGTQMLVVTSGTHDIAFEGLRFEGNGIGAEAVLCQKGSHHVRFSYNVVRHMGAAGFASVGADYLTVDHNQIYRFGDLAGWSSGISLNTSFWADTATGFHSYVVGNIVSGGVDESTNHSDGNGIILDLGGNTPPALIADNLVYENGGRGISTNKVANAWIVGNTVYMNGLDGRVGQTGGFQNQGSTNVHIVNNISWAWTNRYPYLDDSAVTNISYSNNIAYGGLASKITGKVLTLNPLLVNPPAVSPTADGQWKTALDPALVSLQFRLSDLSPAIDSGTTPTTSSGMTTNLSLGISSYADTDLTGAPRPQGAGFDLGSYER